MIQSIREAKCRFLLANIPPPKYVLTSPFKPTFSSRWPTSFLRSSFSYAHYPSWPEMVCIRARFVLDAGQARSRRAFMCNSEVGDCPSLKHPRQYRLLRMESINGARDLASSVQSSFGNQVEIPLTEVAAAFWCTSAATSGRNEVCQAPQSLFRGPVSGSAPELRPQWLLRGSSETMRFPDAIGTTL